MKTGIWLVDAFGIQGFLGVVVAAIVLGLLFNWFFIRPKVVAWMERDPATREKKVRIVNAISWSIAIFCLVLALSTR